MKTLIAIAALLSCGAIIHTQGDTQGDRRPIVVVVGARQWCEPCKKLHRAWDAAETRSGDGYAWRRWVDRHYRIEFVEWADLPKNDQLIVEEIPAAFIHRRRRGRDRAGPFAIPIGSQKHAVAAFGSFLQRKFPPRYAK